MDDVWGNAWAQPEEDVAHSLPTKSKANDVPTWSFRSDEKSKHEEADVGIPSWSTGELNWTEPSGQSSLWSSASAVDGLALEANGWGTSSDLNPKLDSQIDVDEHPYDYKLPTGETGAAGTSEDDTEGAEGISRSSTPGPIGTVTNKVTSGITTSVEQIEQSFSPPPIVLTSFEAPEAPDTFDSFESGDTSVSNSFDEGTITWASPVATFDDENSEAEAWGSAWRTPNLATNDDMEEEGKDEWAMAREQKAMRDRSVPPELLASIIDHLNGLSEDLWLEKDRPRFDQSLGNWRDGIGNAIGLEELMQKALPDTASQPPIKFSGSHSARAMAKSIKLSKNLPVVRNSPMSHLFTAKSLAAWELSVKSKTEIIKDDIPAGWKAVEPEQKGESKTATAEKRSTGLFSYFSKRASSITSPAPTVGGTDSKRSSLSREVLSDTASVLSTKRNSSDANSLSSKMQQSSSVTSLSSSIPATLSSPTAGSFSTKAAPSPSPTALSTNQAQGSASEPASQPTPSAVSRFLNRFSRSRSDTRSSSSSPRSSIALSTDDLEFLSDIVPSHSDDADEDQQLRSLTALVSSPVQSTKLPPPLAPPPLPPPPRPSSLSRSTTPHPQPHSQPLVPPLLSPSNMNSSDPLNDLMKLSAPPSSSSQPAAVPMSSGALGSVLPPPLPPPLSPTSVASISKPPTPSPLSGGAVRVVHSRTPTSTSIRSSSVSPTSGLASPPPVPSPLSSFSPVSSGVTSAGSASFVTPASKVSTQGRSASNFSPLSPIPPPPIEKSPNRDYVQASSNLLEDNEEFSDFQSHDFSSVPIPHMSSSQPKAPSAFNMSFDTPGNGVSSVNEAPQHDRFGDFGSFVSHSSPDGHSPPTSPTSPPIGPMGVPPPLPKKQTPANLNTLHVRKPSAADHDATARLLERAAARPGRWPAPPSPIPNPLPPPPSSGANSRTSTSAQSLLELGDGVPQAPVVPARSIPLKPIAGIMPPTATPSKAVSPPPSIPPPSSSSKQSSTSEASLLDFGDYTQPTLSHAVNPKTSLPLPTSSAGSTKSGLSAQDLSFFEGL
ncbi:hypothetical protein A7U60_g6476 [Sanghuangporus baumii]|uniref:Uncharacterized protein n=1 Tax=Sanghuangporus baumii TaxID=108892 RepID=A0A9Q5N763_SANBA|nr:hypothetical protein A7U60_g6476 [Sanghuangporus baumii]